MNQRAPRTSAQSRPSITRAWALNLAQFFHQVAEFVVSQDQDLEIVGVDLGPGNSSKDLAEPSHHTLFG